jgi:hypothetical protein
MRYACQYIIPFPHIALFMALLQYVIAPWLSIQYPPLDPSYEIGQGIHRYLSYAVPVVVALALSWGLGLTKLRPPPRVQAPPSRQLLWDLDILLALGFAASILAPRFGKTNFAFVFLLLGNLRFVGVYGRMICRGPGWFWRLALVLAVEVLLAAESAMFHTLILWALWTFSIWIYTFKPSWRAVLLAGALSMLLIPALQESKWQLREVTWEDPDQQVSMGKTLSRTSLWLSFLYQSLGHTLHGALDEDFVSDTVMRYNQGWIIYRVMQHVPDTEPYAEGETLKSALAGSILPRFLAPNKAIVGGRANMEKYAGVILTETTSMNLGYAGEMYANFGLNGGVIGCACYALAFALLFRFVCRQAFKSPLWWAIMPYIGFSALKAEDGIYEVVNWTVKSCIVVVAIILLLPAFRRALLGSKSLPSPKLK